MAKGKLNIFRMLMLVLPVLLALGCAPADTPDGTSSKISAAKPPYDRYEGLNEKRDPITRVKLGRDVLVPQPLREDVMPDVMAGPYELRGETLASALQLILDDYDISLAFESNQGLTRRITVANLHGKLRDVVNRVCSLADLYCHFEDDTLTIKDTETFIVDLPPVGGGASGSSSESSSGDSTSTESTSSDSGSGGSSSASAAAFAQIAAGLKAVIGGTPTIDESTRVMIYTATQRTNKYAVQYFERLRKNTALIVYETNIWEVTLNNENRTGINWSALFDNIGNMKVDLVLPGGSGSKIAQGVGAPIKITPDYANGSGNVTSTAVLEFLATRGTVKTISQPQITVLSGSKASFSVQQNQNFVKSTTTTPCSPTPCTPTVTPDTDTVTTGLKMDVTSAWDQATVYGDLNIELDELLQLQDFGEIQLPLTTTRTLQTQIRVRPGDAVLIGGLVSEKDDFADSGPGFMKPLFSTNRVVTKKNTELVFLLRPRVVIFDMGKDSDTPSVVDAPKEGVALKVTPAPVKKEVGGMFDKPAAPATMPNISGDVKDLFGMAPRPAPVSAAARSPSTEGKGGGLNP